MEIISMGAVITDNKGNVLKTFCSYIKPLKYPKIGKYYMKLTKINQEDINKAELFPLVINKFCFEIQNFNIEYFFVFGDKDKEMLKKEIDRYKYKGPFNNIFERVINIQKEISKNIKYNEEIIKNKWSLFDLIKIYSINNYKKQEHDALLDALMLKDVYFAYLNNKPLDENILKKAWEDKKEKDRLLTIEKLKNIDNYFDSNLQIRIKNNDINNLYGITKDLLCFLNYDVQDLKNISKCKEIRILFNKSKKEIDFYYLFDEDDYKIFLPIKVDINNFKKVKKYINYLKNRGYT